MRISCGDFAWTHLPYDLTLDIIAGMGFPGVLVSAFGGYSSLDVRDMMADPVKFGSDVRRSLDARALVAADFFCALDVDFSQTAYNHPDPEVRATENEYFKAAVAAAQTMGSSGLSQTAGWAYFPDEPERELDDAADPLRWRVEYAAGQGVPFSVEAHAGTIAISPTNLRGLLDRVPDLKLTLDYGHFVHAGFTDDDVEPFIPWARDVQVRGGREGLVQARLEDENTIDFRRMVRALHNNGYSGWIAVEYVHDSRPGTFTSDSIYEIPRMRDLIEDELTTLTK
jgi:sugar phosphate isomerase/epimerase